MRRWEPDVPARWLLALPGAVRRLREGLGIAPGEGPADAIVVLGAKVLAGGQPSAALRRRAEAAAALWHEGRAPLVVATGAHHLQPPGEAVVTRRLLLEAGVPAEAVLFEEKSRNTEGNLLFARGLLPPAQNRVYLVTDRYHMARALLYAERQGFVALAWPVEQGPGRAGGAAPRALLREVAGLAMAEAAAPPRSGGPRGAV